MMTQQTFLQRLESLGFYTLPRPHADSPGYSGLLVVLRQTPDGHDPERIQVRLHEWNGKTVTMNLHAEMDQPISHIVCPGQIVIHSRQEREVTFYTFGGSLESEKLSGETVYSFRSTAPVLELVPSMETIADLLANETEVLFARAEAEHNLSSRQLLERLVKAGPEAVYKAVMQSLMQESADKVISDHHQKDLVKHLIRERDWYQNAGRWPIIPRDLSALIHAMSEKQSIRK